VKSRGERLGRIKAECQSGGKRVKTEEKVVGGPNLPTAHHSRGGGGKGSSTKTYKKGRKSHNEKGPNLNYRGTPTLEDIKKGDAQWYWGSCKKLELGGETRGAEENKAGDRR